MIEVSIKVGSGAAHFSVAVRAESIRQALGIARAWYPGSEVRVLFPIDPEAFFAKNPAAAGLGELEMPESVAG